MTIDEEALADYRANDAYGKRMILEARNTGYVKGVDY